MAGAERTTIDSYNLVYTGDGNDTEPTAFPLGVTSGDINLLSPNYGGAGAETKANRLELLFVGDQAGTGTVLVTGASQGGPEECIASLDLTFGTVTESGSDVWCDTITLTSYHITSTGIAVADSGNSHPAKFAFDAVGYQYIRFYTTNFSSVTSVKIYARYF